MIKITADVRPAKVKKSLIKQGEEFWLERDQVWIAVVADRDQESSKSKKLFVREQQPKGSGELIWAFINQLVTPENYEALISGEAEIKTDEDAIAIEQRIAAESAEEAAEVAAEAPTPETPARYKSGEWVLWTVWPGQVKAAQCTADQGEFTQQVHLTRWEADKSYKFSATADKLTRIDSPEAIVEATANKDAVEAIINAPNAPAQVPYTLPNRLSTDTPKPIKKGDRFWWRQTPTRYRFAVVQVDQANPEATKVCVLHWAENGSKSKGPEWVKISDLLTEAEYKKHKQSLAKTGGGAVSSSQTEETPAPEVKAVFTSPAEFAEVMKQQQTPEAIKALCDRLLALPRFNPEVISAKTKMQRLCDYNKAIKAAQIELTEGVNAIAITNTEGGKELRHLYFKYVGIIDHDWEAARKIAGGKVVKKLDNRVEVDADQYIETVKFCLVSDDPFEVFAGLVAASGRRPVEVAHCGIFTYHGLEYGGEYHLLFEGHAKKREGQLDKHGIEVIGCTAETFLKKLDFVRTHPKIKSKIDAADPNQSDFLKVLSDPIRVQVNRAIAKKFSWLPTRVDENSQTCKTLRSIWAAMVTTLHCKLETNPLLSASRLLGHFEGDPASLLTTLGYSDIIIKTSPDSFPKRATSPANAPDLDEDEDEELLEAATVEAEDAIEDLEDGEVEQETAELLQGPGVPDNVIATAIAMPIPYSQVVEDSGGERHPNDFYETPAWAGLSILEYAGITGTIGECSNGNGAISTLFKMAGFEVWTNDIDPQKTADYHGDATDPAFWDTLPDTDWIVTNPPYAKLSAPIVINAFNKAKKGIAMVLKMNWWELCADRADFLKKHPPTGFINFPRYCYRKGTITKKWATDEAPTVVYIWDKSITHGLTQTIPLTADDLRLFHRTPDETPAIELIEAEVNDIMQKRAQTKPVKPSPVAKAKPAPKQEETQIGPDGFDSVEPKNIARITEKMQPFLTYNAALEPSDRWYVGQTIVKAIAGCNNSTAHAWINFYKDFLEGHNKGLNPVSHNRKRAFSWE